MSEKTDKYDELIKRIEPAAGVIGEKSWGYDLKDASVMSIAISLKRIADKYCSN